MPPRCNIAKGIKKNKMKVKIDNSVLCLRFGALPQIPFWLGKRCSKRIDWLKSACKQKTQSSRFQGPRLSPGSRPAEKSQDFKREECKFGASTFLKKCRTTLDSRAKLGKILKERRDAAMCIPIRDPSNSHKAMLYKFWHISCDRHRKIRCWPQ